MKQVKGKSTRRCRILALTVFVACVGWVHVSTNLAVGIPQVTMESLHENSPLIHVLSQSVRLTTHKDVTKLSSLEVPKKSERVSNTKATKSVPFQFPPLPKVQAWPDNGDVKPPKMFPPTDRKLFETIEDLLSFQSDLEGLAANHHTTSDTNPMQPSMMDIKNPLSLLNVEIPLGYSVEAPVTSTIPWSNESTMAFYEGRFYSGFRNQIMAFMILIFESQRERSEGKTRKRRHGQILLRSLGQKDTYGTNSFIPFAKLWDVVHWNSHYPRLPRLVDYDPTLHSQFNYDNTRWFRTPKFSNSSSPPLPEGVTEPRSDMFGTYGLFVSATPTRPYAFGYQHKMMGAYVHYAKGKGEYIGPKGSGHQRNPAEILMLQGAMRPHPELQAILDRLLQNSSLLDQGQSTANTGTLSAPLQLDYLTLHARVEPDMQKHVMCRDKKVLNLTDIFGFMEEKWKDPPVSRIFMPINRQYLELEGDLSRKKKRGKAEVNWIAVENLNALNRARDEGLWGGRAKVLEFGTNALEGTSYWNKPSTAGAMLNFFIGVPAKVFIGTEVSSFSHDILATRFFRGYQENYKYLPGGLMDWTPPGTRDPSGFQC